MTNPPLQATATELLPCPFCGQQPEMEPWHGGAPTKVMITCVGLHPEAGFIDCGPAPSVTGETPDEAIAAWNTRPNQEATPDDAELAKRLFKHAYKLPEGYYSDTDFGCNGDSPESLIMAELDSGPRGTEIMQVLTAYDFTIVETEALKLAAERLAAAPVQEATRTVRDAELPDASVMGELAFAARAMRSKKQRELAKLEAKNPIDEHLPSMRKRLARLEEGYLWLNDVRADAPDTAKPDPEAVTRMELVEALADWQNSWLCPVTDFAKQIPRLLSVTRALLTKATRP